MAQKLRIQLQCRSCGFNPWVGKIPKRRKGQPTLALLPGKSCRGAWWSSVHGVKRVRLTKLQLPPGSKKSLKIISLADEVENKKACIVQRFPGSPVVKNCRGLRDSVPDHRTKIPCSMQHGQEEAKINTALVRKSKTVQ